MNTNFLSTTTRAKKKIIKEVALKSWRHWTFFHTFGPLDFISFVWTFIMITALNLMKTIYTT